MLGVCGSKADLPMLEAMITSGYEDKQPFIDPLVTGALAMGGPLDLPSWPEITRMDERRKKLGLDAMIGCYMVLRGPEGLDLIDEKFFKREKAEYSYIYAASLALRFLAEETDIVPRNRLLQSARLLLDNEQFADQIILDLARWEDWSVMDRLIAMFKSSTVSGYVRTPIIAYLLAAVEQPGPTGAKATQAIADLEKIDAEAVKRARTQMAFGFLQRARSIEPASATQSVGTVVAPADGLTASAADAAKSGQNPPDPATFAKDPSRQATTTRAGRATMAATEPVASASVEKGNAQSATSPANAADQAAAAPTPRTLFVVGLPLAAAVLLVAVFWIILRGSAA
jgi:hypothetical protein